MKLSKNFCLAEMLRSQLAERHGITEQFSPPENVKENLKALCRNILQPLRDSLKKPILVSSGYRCVRLNSFVGGSPRSDHLTGKAADLNFFINGREENLRLAIEVIKLKLSFKQMILEGGTLHNPRWIHISYDLDKKKNIREILFANFSFRPVAYIRLKFTNGVFKPTG